MVFQKRIAQLNFLWSPLYTGHAGEVIRALSEKFPEHALTGDEWRFRNKDKHWIGSFAPDRVSVSWEASTDRAGFVTNAITVFEQAQETLDLEAPFVRLGYRTIALSEVPDFDAARRQVCNALLQETAFAGDHFVRPPDDMVLVLEANANPDSNDLGYRVRVAPVRKSEFTGKHRGLLSFPDLVSLDAGIIFDVDAWLLKVKTLRDSLRDLSSTVEDVTKRLLEEWFEEE